MQKDVGMKMAVEMKVEQEVVEKVGGGKGRDRVGGGDENGKSLTGSCRRYR